VTAAAPIRMKNWRSWLRAVEKLDRLTVKAGPGECWLWQGYTAPNGYGWVNVYGLAIAAHRLALIVSGVEVPAELDACHRCDVRNCVNPAHLYAGTRAQNMADCIARGRHNKPRGIAHPRARLSDADVRAIRQRRAAGEGVTPLGIEYGVHHGWISRTEVA
jgi:hypothetical protein